MGLNPQAALALSLLLGGCALPPGQDRTRPLVAASTFVAGLGESYDAGGAIITPLAIVEESRCPRGVQCIQAGTVRLQVGVRTRGRETSVTIGLNCRAQVSDVLLRLLDVTPYPERPGPVLPGTYRFRFALDPEGSGQADEHNCAS